MRFYYVPSPKLEQERLFDARVSAADSAYPSRDGLEVVELYEDYRFVADGGSGEFASFFDRIVIRNAMTRMEVDSFEVGNDTYGPLRLSPDGQSLAAFWSKSNTCFNENTTLSVHLKRHGWSIDTAQGRGG